MNQTIIKCNDYDIAVFSLNTVVVGTGAAGFNAADCLYQHGQNDIAIVTEHINAGTSRNTGSDKQTYYKLSLSGDNLDSVHSLAQVLFHGECVDGDIALCEAAMSAQSFLKLVELGVPFPKNRYGEYIGYKTDHDPSKRATSVGPYTSKIMTECLEKSVVSKNITIFNNLQVIRILTKNDEVKGLLCLNLEASENPNMRYVLFNCKNVIYATGGPAGMYADSAYPNGHYGSTGIAFEAGVKGKNLTEWQYGLASIKPRWNVSGTYMQVLPRFISTDENGNNPREFLFDFFEKKEEMLSKVFLKGYQWPFDVRKIDNGSSIIDILVYIETCMKGRRVFLDFRKNPKEEKIGFQALDPEAYEYLEKAGACFGTPLDRLLHMNAPAVDFYRDRGVNLHKEMLEIALCAQHNNGGLSIDAWWQTNVTGFFAVGEVSASHGVYRPGGSALNAGQVGSARAAQYIAACRSGNPQVVDELLNDIIENLRQVITLSDNIITSKKSNVEELWKHVTNRMSRIGAAIRRKTEIQDALTEIKDELKNFNDLVKINSPKQLKKVYRLYDVLVAQYVYLYAMINYSEHGGQSRGSALYYDKGGKLYYNKLPEEFCFTLDTGVLSDKIQEVVYKKYSCNFSWRQVRDIPKEDDFFENVWRSYRENGNTY